MSSAAPVDIIRMAQVNSVPVDYKLLLIMTPCNASKQCTINMRFRVDVAFASRRWLAWLDEAHALPYPHTLKDIFQKGI